MKYLIIGDIHGRPFWKDAIEQESPDMVIFLGDYVTTHELYTPEQQLEQLELIMQYKESHPDNVIMLRGNHDLDGLGYYWARCYPSAVDVQAKMNKDTDFGQRFLNLTQWCYVFEVAGKPTICAHAGISTKWLSNILNMNDFDPAAINEMEPSEKFAFTGGYFDSYGTDPQQSITWIRPETLQEYAIPGWDQIVGHTGTHICSCQARQTINKDTIWCCDALQQKAFLVIEDDEYQSKVILNKP